MKRFFNLIFLLLVSYSLFARVQVDTITVHSTKMNKDIKAVVIVPENYSNKKEYPVVYLLHGYSDNYAKWVNTVPSIKNLATEHQLIIVCPDGGFSSWYIDSPIDSTFQYESYITKDVLPFVDAHYSTIKDRKARAITGHSMGGHGALYIAIRNKDLFAHAGSMSGGVDLRASSQKYDITKRIGDMETNPKEWENRSVVNMVNSLKNNELDLIIDCGVSDFFYQINKGLHNRLLALKIAHDYIERPGNHSWEYWANSIQYQLLYFDNCFKK
ncbi:MAG: alpha/beta hydrolase-fold protein [Paludibacter sp.]|nr:alpha/beta hydrolase-fold protein [Paludibacter sp.]